MCPLKEYTFRSKRNLLATFETDEETSIAEFLRPGAGQVISPSDIRTPDTLKSTTDYLLGPYLLNLEYHGESWLYTTNFITDRLRQVRKETIQQNLAPSIVIYLLERLIRYHLLIAWKLHYEDEKDYDPHLNDSLLDTYFSDLMEAYSHSKAHSKANLVNYYEFRSYYLLRNLNQSNIILADLQLTDYMDDTCVHQQHKGSEDSSPQSLHRLCQCLSSQYLLCNYYKVLDIMAKHLTFLQCCVLLSSIDSIRISFLCILNKSYGLKFSLTRLCSWLKFDGLLDLNRFLEVMDIKFDAQFAYFNKDITVKEVQAVQLRRMSQNFSYMVLVSSKIPSDTDWSVIVNGNSDARENEE